jgi:hypothetical protein
MKLCIHVHRLLCKAGENTATMNEGLARGSFPAMNSLSVTILQEADLKRLHEGALKSDPFISRAVGPKAKVERMKAAALRLGSQGVPRSYDDHLIIVGDAAGHIDPLTGEGIHTAIMVSVLSRNKHMPGSSRHGHGGSRNFAAFASNWPVNVVCLVPAGWQSSGADNPGDAGMWGFL